MTEDLRIQIGRDLSSIAEMFVKLRSEAVNRAGDPDIPGGAAMVLLGPGADVEAWGYVQMSALFGRLESRKGRYRTRNLNGKELAAVVADKDIEPPLSFLASWADIVREARMQGPSTRRAEIAREIEYLRSALDWMLSSNEDGEPWFIEVESFADGLNQVRHAMENVLHAGDRLTRIKARCMYCDQGPRLARQYVDNQPDDKRDFWFCPNRACGHVYDAGGVQRCWDHRLRMQGIENAWVTLTDAAKNLGRPVRTLRTWVNTPPPYAPVLASRRNPVTGRVEVEWSAALTVNDTRERRNGPGIIHARVLSSA